MTAPASPRLRWLTAALLLAGAALSLVLPFVSATFLTLLLGSAAVVAAISQFLRLSGEPDTRGKVFRALSGVLYLIGGLSCIVFPIQSTISLTLFVGALLVTEGVMELAAAASQSLPARGLVLLDGIVTAVLGGMLIAGWPSDSQWAIGTLFAISLAFSAVNLLTAPPQGATTTNA
ncbi:MAG: HdeD family acid-resistance protein [Cyanobacteriota bacterium]